MEHILKSRYGIGEKMSDSPFSVTYRGFFIGTDKPVVIKIYKRGTLNSALIRDMKQKVKSFSLINHHGIAKLIDGDYGWQGFYYVRELIAGRSIAELLGSGETLGVERAVEIAEQVLGALEEAHARGMVHGAIKPANIFIDSQGLVRLTDFVIEGEIKESYPQKVAEISLNAKYASPEEVEGRSAGPAADFFSLGLVLYEMATGRPALQETGLSGNIRKLKEAALLSKTDLSSLPKYLAEIILKATSRDPLQRFATAAEFRESLEQKGIAAKKTGREEYLQMYENIVVQYGGEEVDQESEAIQEIGNFRLRWSKEKHRTWILGAAVGISVALGILYAFFFGR